VPQPPTWGHWQYKRVADSFLSHVRYLFSLRANPTKKIVDPNRPKVIRPDGSIDRNKNAKRIPLLRLEELRAWIQRKGREQGGFVLDESQETGQPLVITKEPRHRLRIEGSGVAGGGNQLNRYQGVCLNSVLFEGVLVVTDHARFTETFLHGVGSAKGFGFGMLVLDPRPVSQLSTPNHPLVST
jgi:CRISPR system Cascade subunit CasE